MKFLALLLGILVTLPVWAEKPIVSKTHQVSTPQRGEAKPEARTTGIFEADDETTYGFEGDTPYVDIFNDTFLQARIAGRINETVYAEETNPVMKARLHRGNELRVTFDGLIFRKVKDQPGLFEIFIIGPVRTAKVKKKLSVEDLLAGKSFLEIPMPRVGRNIAGIGSAAGGGTLSFHYDRAAKKIVVDEFKGDFSLTLGFTQKDSGTLSNKTLVPKTIEERPLMEGKYLLRD